jgi:hypothetical protein
VRTAVGRVCASLAVRRFASTPDWAFRHEHGLLLERAVISEYEPEDSRFVVVEEATPLARREGLTV